MFRKDKPLDLRRKKEKCSDHHVRGALLDHEAEAVHLIDALGAVESLAGASKKEEETK